MDNLKFALVVMPGLGDTIIAKKIFETLTILDKNCTIDIFGNSERSCAYIKAFYGDEENLRNILVIDEVKDSVKVQDYDLTLHVHNCVIIIWVNEVRLNALNPELHRRIFAMSEYNKKYMYHKDFAGQMLLFMAQSRILKTNCFTVLASGGALPIYDNRVKINLSPEWKTEFEKLRLKKYITIGANGGPYGRHAIKEWPTRYYVEMISLLKTKMPDVEIIQLGGEGIEKAENADRYLLGENLELVKYVLKNSVLHIDCEGGLVHLASQLDTKCVVFFGVTDVDYYGYSQNINLVSEVCKPCYFAWMEDSTCLLGAKVPPCMLSITPQKVFDVVYRYLKFLEETA